MEASEPQAAPAPIATLEIVDATKVQTLDTIACQYAAALTGDRTNIFSRAILLAQGVQQLRSLLTDELMQPIMALMNTRLGFRTDRDPNRPVWKNGRQETPQPYPVAVVRECVIEAVLKDFRLVGNEFNIIAGGFYGTKEGFSGKLARIEGLKDLKVSLGVPRMKEEKGAIVPFAASWVYQGRRAELLPVKEGEPLEIAIRVNEAQGADAILGKAERKIKARIYAQITGSEVADGEVDDLPAGIKTAEKVPAERTTTNAFADVRTGDASPTTAPEKVEEAAGKQPEPASELPLTAAEPPKTTSGPAIKELIALIGADGLDPAHVLAWAIDAGHAPKSAQRLQDIPENAAAGIVRDWEGVSRLLTKRAKTAEASARKARS